jgi:uncharacterized 2Fe-2S/4Fe-4S cluster protein (DUF4445 family)
MALLMTEADVARLLPMALAIEAVEITLFESQGVAMEDVAVAARVVARARAESVGQELPL